MTKEQLGNLIITSEDTMYHVAKTLLYSDADCADAIHEAIVKHLQQRMWNHQRTIGWGLAMWRLK